jgi:hypothetical protein
MKPLTLFTAAVLVVPLLACATAEAGRGGWSIAVGVGAPAYPRPHCCHDYYYYPRHSFLYVRPAPVFVPVPAVEPPPVVYPTYRQPETAPRPTPLPPEADPGQANQYLRRLADPDEKARAEAAVQLGRMGVARAVDPLAATLAGDRSPQVREAAARALGLIGSPRAMPALRRASQADASQDVRQSALFSIEVIQASSPTVQR